MMVARMCSNAYSYENVHNCVYNLTILTRIIIHIVNPIYCTIKVTRVPLLREKFLFLLLVSHQISNILPILLKCFCPTQFSTIFLKCPVLSSEPSGHINNYIYGAWGGVDREQMSNYFSYLQVAQPWYSLCDIQGGVAMLSVSEWGSEKLCHYVFGVYNMLLTTEELTDNSLSRFV